jgi:hypothetical protein
MMYRGPTPMMARSTHLHYDDIINRKKKMAEDVYRITTAGGTTEVETREQAAVEFREHVGKPDSGSIEVWQVATDANWAMKVWSFDPPVPQT